MNNLDRIIEEPVKHLLLCAICVLALMSCTVDVVQDGPSRGMAKISLIARMPAAMTAQTRGETGTEAENAITDILTV